MEHNIYKLWDNYQRCNICIMGIPEGDKERKEQKKYLKQRELSISPINVRHQITDPRNSENTKQDKRSKIIPGNIIFKLQKTKIKKKS